MSYFYLKPDVLKNIAEDLNTFAIDIKSVSDEVRNISANMSGWSDTFAGLSRSCLRISDKIEKNSISMDELHKALTYIISAYETADRQVSGNTSISTAIKNAVSTIADKFRDFLSKIGKIFKGKNTDTSSYDGDPVDMVTGNYVDEVTDLRITGPSGLRFVRHYNSILPVFSSMGPGWSHNYEVSLSGMDDFFTVRWGDGTCEYFSEPEEGIRKSCFGNWDYIEECEEGFIYRRFKGASYFFNKTGILLRKETPSGTGNLWFEYNEETRLSNVYDCYGNCLFYFYNDKGLLEKVEDHTGRKISFAYNEGYLSSVLSADGLAMSYEYDDGGRMEKIIGSGGEVRLENRYDTKDRVIFQRLADSAEITISYEDFAVRMTDADGSETVYHHDEKGRIIEAEYPLGVEKISYNSFNQRISYTDLNGNTYKREYDSSGNLVSYTDPLGNTSRFFYDEKGNRVGSEVPDCGSVYASYNDCGQMVRFTDSMGGVTLFSYTDGLLTGITYPDGTQESFSYNKKGLLIETCSETGAVERHSYDELGRRILDIDPTGAETRYEYDECDRITRVVNAQGLERIHIYENGRLVSVRDFDGYTETRKYDRMGRVIEAIDKSGSSTFYEYDKMSNLSVIRLPDGGVVKREYDVMGRLTAVDGPEEGRLEYTYDPNGNCVCRSEDGVITRWTYDAMNHIRKMELPGGGISTYEYDRAGRIVRRELEDGSVYKYAYAEDGQLTCVEQPGGLVIEYLYDVRRRLARKSNGISEDTAFEYYPDGSLKEVLWKDGFCVKTEYDAAGRPVSEQRNDGYTLRYAYDLMGRRKSITDSEGRKKTWEYDASGNPVRVTDSLGRVTSYVYSPAGKPVFIIDADGNETRYSYDSMGRLTGMLRGNIPPEEASSILSAPYGYLKSANKDVRLTRWEYDTAGRMTSRTDALGNTAHWVYCGGNINPEIFVNEEGEETRYLYDEAGRLSSVIYGDGRKADYSYDRLGQQEEISDWTGCFKTSFDFSGRLTSVTDANKEKIIYNMDPAGRLQKMVYPDEREYSYTYDKRGFLSQISSPGFLTAYQYDGNGRVIEKTISTGASGEEHAKSLIERYQYDVSGKLLHMKQSEGESPVTEYSFRYDLLGNVTVQNITEWCGDESTAEELSYTYDGMNRLTAVKSSSSGRGLNLKEQYVYDSFGNCVSSVRDGILAENSYNVLDQLVSSRITDEKTGKQTIYTCSYDKCGRLSEVDCTEQSDREFRKYDSAGHLEKIETAKGALHLKVNSQGHVVSEFEDGAAERDFWYDYRVSSMPVIGFADKDGTTSLIRDEKVLGLLQQDKWGIYLCDEKGSVKKELRGNHTDRADTSPIYKYDSFGKVIGGSSSADDLTGIGYTGLYRNPLTGTWRTASREYSPMMGRFLSRDLDRYLKPSRPETLNLYQYCYNNPVIWVDPEGTDCYIFYKEESKAHSYTQRKQLAKKYGYDISKVHMIPLTNAADFEKKWNAMGNENGEIVSVDTVIIESHGDPYGISGNKNFSMNTGDIRNLQNKDMDNLILEGCNVGHLDHVNENVASEFARKTNGAPVLAADGTVYYGMGWFGIQFPWTKSWYDPRGDQYYENWRPDGSTRESQGWVVYRDDNGTITTDIVGKKKMTASNMVDELRKYPKHARSC